MTIRIGGERLLCEVSFAGIHEIFITEAMKQNTKGAHSEGKSLICKDV